MELLVEFVNRGIMLSLLLSLPVVLAAAVIGLVVGILQAVTQVQEQTIAAAPKILGVFAVLLICSNLMLSLLQDYVREAFQVAFNEIPQEGVFLLPPSPKGNTGASRAKRFFQDTHFPGSRQDRLQGLRGTSNVGNQQLDNRTPQWRPESRTDSSLNNAEKRLLKDGR